MGIPLGMFLRSSGMIESVDCFCPSPVADLLILSIPLRRIKVGCRLLFDT